MKRFFKLSRKASQPARRSNTRRLAIETMEDRRMKSVSPVLNNVSDDIRPNAPDACNIALTAPLAAVATMPSSAQRNRPASVLSNDCANGPDE